MNTFLDDQVSGAPAVGLALRDALLDVKASALPVLAGATNIGRIALPLREDAAEQVARHALAPLDRVFAPRVVAVCQHCQNWHLHNEQTDLQRRPNERRERHVIDRVSHLADDARAGQNPGGCRPQPVVSVEQETTPAATEHP